MKDNILSIDQLLARHFSNERLTSEQEEVLTAWIVDHKEEYRQLSQVLSSKQFDTDQAWKIVSSRLTPSHKSLRIPFRKILAYAACILLLVGVTHYFLTRSEDDALLYSNDSHELMAVTLPDSSEVVLYPHSSVNYRQSSASDRDVALEGKAFFKVRRQQGHPFVVHSHAVQVKVLGTAFLVESRPDQETGVYVREGLVSVSTADQQVLLSANQQATVKRTLIEKDTLRVPAQIFKAHIPTRVYHNAPLSEVLKEVEQEFHVDIQVDSALLASRVSTTIKMTQVEDILNELSYICNGKYQKIACQQYRMSSAD